MVSCKTYNLTFNYYTTTTTLCIQLAKKKFFSLLNMSGTTSIDITNQGEANNNTYDDGDIFAAINGSEDPMVEIFTIQDATKTGTPKDPNLLGEIRSLKEDFTSIKHLVDV